MTFKMLQNRTHNNKALNVNLHGGDAKYKDTEKEKMIRAVEAKQRG